MKMIYIQNSSFISFAIALTGALALTSCAHHEVTNDSSPAWTKESPRTLVNDRIYFVATGENKFADRAQGDAKTAARNAAEGAALEDIANECSMVPGAFRQEDEFSVDSKTTRLVTVKMSVSAADCLKAQNTFAPEDIRIFASQSATQKILKHQDATGEANDPSNGTQDPVKPGDLDGLIQARQQVALKKQAVILSNTNRYRLHSRESKNFYQNIKAESEPLLSLEKDSSVQQMKMTWSSTHQHESNSVPVPVLSSDSPAAAPTPSAQPGKRKGPKATPKSFPKN